MDCGRDEVRKQIVTGAERFEVGGRSPLQSRCVQLARMGCVVFHYDMIGYADSVQIPFALAHGFAKQRSEMNTVEQGCSAQVKLTCRCDGAADVELHRAL